MHNNSEILFSRRRMLAVAGAKSLVAGSALLIAPDGAVAQEGQKNRAPTPQDFGAIGDGIADDSAAFKLLSAKPGVYIRVPQGRYLIKDSISILEQQVWQFEGAELIHEGPGPLFQAIAVDDWAMLGVARLTGAGSTAQTRVNVGLLISTCRRFRVSRLQFSNFNGVGLGFSGNTAYLNHRGERGQLSDLAFTGCTRGIEVAPNASSEYNIFTNITVTDCGQGIFLAAGNCQFVGGNVVDCGTGVVLLPGPNHGHGGFHAFNLTHSREYNVYAYAIENGFTFNACHFAGDGGMVGAIYLRDSKGIMIQGGQIDCAVINDGKTGKNFLMNSAATGPNYKIVSNSGDAGGVVCRNVMRFDGSDACLDK